MIANQRNTYCFFSDENKKYLRAVQELDGSYTISKNSSPYPILYNPANLVNSEFEFATNMEYFSLFRSISYPLEFIKDGAAILRNGYYKGKGTQQKIYLTIIEWNGKKNIYELSYYGRVDYDTKKEDPKSGSFTVSVMDDSAWGVLSQNDKVQYAIDCSSTNPKAIKVLLDGMTLDNTAVFQTVDNSIISGSGVPNNFTCILGMLLVNQTGDSYGTFIQSQSKTFIYSLFPDRYNYYKTGLGAFYKNVVASNIKVEGSIKFKTPPERPNADLRYTITLDTYRFAHATSPYVILDIRKLSPGVVYDIPFSFNVDLLADEALYLVIQNVANYVEDVWGTIISTEIKVTMRTKQQPVIAYGLRPLDLLKELVDKGTDGRFTINSEFLTENDMDICISGDSIRGVPNSKIYSSFNDFFKTFDSIYWMAMKQVKGNLFLEKATDVYRRGDDIIDLGNCIDISLEPAIEFYCNEIEVGSPKQDYRHPSGRLEFNSTNTFSLRILTVDKKLDIVSKYRLGCYDAQFLLLDYKGQSTQDNSGDKSVYLLRISNEQGNAVDDIETFENINVNSLPLAPIIKTPLDNDFITYNKPVISGVAPAGTTVNIYCDSVLDGGTVTDSEGNWSYEIVNALSSYEEGVHTGIHLIQSTYTDLSGESSSLTIFIDDSEPSELQISYPGINDNLYNNTPLIKGVAQKGTVVNLSIDGISIGTVTADSSCRWTFRTPVISNGSHSLEANTDSVNFNVDSYVSFPLITYIGGELDGSIIVNNEPLIKGVAKPGTVVDIWLNYISYSKIGTAVANETGNWEFQTVPIDYKDPLSGFPVILVPIRNGISVISTFLENKTVKVFTSGYILSRPKYSLITGVIDNTVYNTEYSPKRMAMSRFPLFSSIMDRQKDGLYFQTADKNGNLSTTLGGVTITENTDIPYSSLGNPLMMLEYAVLKTRTSDTFAKILENFSSGGLVKTNYRGTDIFMLPIGSMKIANINNDVKEWRLLISPLTSYDSLLNLYKNGTIINIMKNSIYHSDYNTLHFVKYNFERSIKYNNSTIYENWFNERNDAWVINPKYIQKVQRTDIIRDQVITNGVTGLCLKIYTCKNAKLVDTINYNPISPVLIPVPNVLSEAVVDMTNYPESQYFFVMCVDIMAESEMIVKNQSMTVPNSRYQAGFEGNVSSTDIVTVDIYVNGSVVPVSFIVPMTTATDLEEAIALIISSINEDERFTATVEDYIGDLGIRIESEGVDIYCNTKISSSLLTSTPVSISERIETKDKWRNTILIEASSSINKVGFFYSTGIKSIYRVEGLVKKLQPDLKTIIAREENGNSDLLYSEMAKKRMIRFGSPVGLPDYLYLKMSNSLALDTLKVENDYYTLAEDENITPSDDVDGFPMYYYEVMLNQSINKSGAVFPASNEESTEGAVLVVDAIAFGLPEGSLININLTQ